MTRTWVSDTRPRQANFNREKPPLRGRTSLTQTIQTSCSQLKTDSYLDCRLLGSVECPSYDCLSPVVFIRELGPLSLRLQTDRWIIQNRFVYRR